MTIMQDYAKQLIDSGLHVLIIGGYKKYPTTKDYYDKQAEPTPTMIGQSLVGGKKNNTRRYPYTYI